MLVVVEFTDGTEMRMRCPDAGYWAFRKRLAEGESIQWSKEGYTITLFPKGIVSMEAIKFDTYEGVEILIDEFRGADALDKGSPN